MAGPHCDAVFGVTHRLSENRNDIMNSETVKYIRGQSVWEGIKPCGILAFEEEVGKIGNNKVLCSPFVSSNCPFPVIQIERGRFKLHCNKYKSVTWKNCLT